MGTQTNPAQAMQDALNQIEAQYAAAEKFIDSMQGDENKYNQYEKSAAYWLSQETYTTIGYQGYANHHTSKTAVDNYNSSIKNANSIKQKIDGEEKELQKLFGNAFSKLDATLDTLLDMMKTIATSGGALDLEVTDLNQISTLLNKLFQAFKEKLKGEVYDNEMSGNMASKLTDNELEQLACDGMASMNAESETVNSLSDDMKTLIQSYATDKENAKVDRAYYAGNIWKEWFEGGDSKERRDDQIIKNADLMMGQLGKAMDALAAEQAEIMPQFVQVIDEIKEIMKEVKGILADTKLTGSEKEGKVLALVMYLMTFFQVVKQNVESKKAENNQAMSQGTIHASQTNIQETTDNEKIKEEMEHNASIMKITMVVAQVVLGTIMTLMAPGIGTAIAMGLVTAFEAMQTEGVVNVTGALAKAIGGPNGQIYADVIVAVAEALVTMGAGCGLDGAEEGAMAPAVAAATDAAVDSAAQEIETAAMDAAAAAGKGGDATATAAANDTITEVAEKAAKKAAEGAAKQFMKQPFATLVELLAKGTFSKTLNQVMEKAAQEAVETSIEDTATIAKLAARGIESTDEIMEEISTSAANRSVARASGKKLSTIAKEALVTPARQAVSRGLWTLMFGLANNNFISDLNKKGGWGNKGWEEFLQIVQQLMQMIAMMVGSGMVGAANMEGVLSNLPRTANMLSVFPQGAQAAASYANYKTYEVESKAIQGLSMNGSVADLLHSFLEQLQKDNSTDREIMTKDLEQWGESTAALAGHMQDGDRSAIQVLISAV